MIHPIPGIANTGFYVIQLQIWKFFNDLIETETIRQKVQNIDHTDTHTPYARPTAALARFNGDSIIIFHVLKMTTSCGFSRLTLVLCMVLENLITINELSKF